MEEMLSKLRHPVQSKSLRGDVGSAISMDAVSLLTTNIMDKGQSRRYITKKRLDKTTEMEPR